MYQYLHRPQDWLDLWSLYCLGRPWFAIFSALRQNLSVLETNITQTAGSAAGSMASAAGLVAAIPAMEMLGYKVSTGSLMLWSLAVAFLGVFAVPLRRQVVEIDKLDSLPEPQPRKPFSRCLVKPEKLLAKARVLIWAGVIAGLFTLTAHFIPQLESPPLHKWVDIGVLTVAASWSFKFYFGPSLFGAGFRLGHASPSRLS